LNSGSGGGGGFCSGFCSGGGGHGNALQHIRGAPACHVVVKQVHATHLKPLLLRHEVVRQVHKFRGLGEGQLLTQRDNDPAPGFALAVQVDVRVAEVFHFLPLPLRFRVRVDDVVNGFPDGVLVVGVKRIALAHVLKRVTKDRALLHGGHVGCHCGARLQV
jgi:hypothetical protein